MIILIVRMVILMGQDDGFPTPPHPTPAFPFNLMAFPFNVLAFPNKCYGVPSDWAFPVTGRSHGLAAAPGHGQVALGAKKVARGPHSGPPSWVGLGGVCLRFEPQLETANPLVRLGTLRTVPSGVYS